MRQARPGYHCGYHRGNFSGYHLNGEGRNNGKRLANPDNGLVV